MTKTDWILQVLIPHREAVWEIEYGYEDISDLLVEIERKGMLSVRQH